VRPYVGPQQREQQLAHLRVLQGRVRVPGEGAHPGQEFRVGQTARPVRAAAPRARRAADDEGVEADAGLGLQPVRQLEAEHRAVAVPEHRHPRALRELPGHLGVRLGGRPYRVRVGLLHEPLLAARESHRQDVRSLRRPVLPRCEEGRARPGEGQTDEVGLFHC
jgi:hypothetical protein